jgi:hypothetical protein
MNPDSNPDGDPFRYATGPPVSGPDTLTFIQYPKLLARLRINPRGGGQTLTIDSTIRRPNWFRRFWYWALLGWTWKDLTKKENTCPAQPSLPATTADET